MIKAKKKFSQAELAKAAESAATTFEREAAHLQSRGHAIDGHSLKRGKFYLWTLFAENGGERVSAWRDDFSKTNGPATVAFNYGVQAGFAELGVPMPEDNPDKAGQPQRRTATNSRTKATAFQKG